MNLVENTAMNSQTDGKTGELPVENVGDGDGTFIAGTPNPHLSIRNAIECIVARVYFASAFLALSPADQEAFIDANELDHLALIVALIAEDMSINTIVHNTYIALVPNVEDFIDIIAERVEKVIGIEYQAHLSYAEKLDRLHATFMNH